MLREILKLQARSGISGRNINQPKANPIARQLRHLKILAALLVINMNWAYKFIDSMVVWGKRVTLTKDGHLW